MYSVVEGIKNLPSLINDKIKGLFIPDQDHLNSIFEGFRNNFLVSFGLNVPDLNGIIGVESNITSQTGTVSLWGIGDISATFFNPQHLVTAVATFRPYIRGFLVILLIMYNLRSAYKLLNIGDSENTGKDGTNDN